MVEACHSTPIESFRVQIKLRRNKDGEQIYCFDTELVSLQGNSSGIFLVAISFPFGNPRSCISVYGKGNRTDRKSVV